METQMRDWKMTMNFKQSAKGEWYVDKLGVKADNKEDLSKGADEAIEVMREKIGKLRSLAQN